MKQSKVGKNIDLYNSIKSKYILKGVFSYLDETSKLLIVEYNKNIQKLLDFNIEYYKTTSERYVEGEKNGKGKEYLLYSLDKNGKNILFFEGEYKNGKKYGKGKEYYKNGKIKFKNGRRRKTRRRTTTKR